jgi:branched-chain amino acid transport system substrate-binding protein
MMRWIRARFLARTAVIAASAVAVAACAGTASTTRASDASSDTVTIGISEPLTGAFAADGQASEKGYQLWASDVNAAGGLLGHQVRLKILNDNNAPKEAAQQYTRLIATDHVNFVLGPFSSPLAEQAVPVAEKYGYALPEGSGVSAGAFNLGVHNLFAIRTPDAAEMVPFANWVISLPASVRPKTAAYPMVADPSADPPVQTTEAFLQSNGIRTVYTNSADPITASDLTPYARAVAALKPDAVVLGSADVPTVLAFIHVFEQENFTPKVFIATAGPEQGLTFLNTVGPANATGIMVPEGWSGGFSGALSHVMVQDYIAKFGGTASGINADVAESYSAGEVLADAVSATRSLENAKVLTYLHSDVTLQTVQGPARFDDLGENIEAPAFIFQWQSGRFVQVLPASAAGSVPIEATKQPWLTSR